MSADKDILTKEIESWTGFEYALRKENRTLFVDCAAAKGESFSTAALVLVLIFEQQKMINELIRKLGKADRI
jgi:hypothetical protein